MKALQQRNPRDDHATTLLREVTTSLAVEPKVPKVKAIFSFPTDPIAAFQDHILRVQEVRIQSKGCRRSEERVRRRVTKKHKKKKGGKYTEYTGIFQTSNQK